MTVARTFESGIRFAMVLRGHGEKTLGVLMASLVGAIVKKLVPVPVLDKFAGDIASKFIEALSGQPDPVSVWRQGCVQLVALAKELERKVANGGKAVSDGERQVFEGMLIACSQSMIWLVCVSGWPMDRPMKGMASALYDRRKFIEDYWMVQKKAHGELADIQQLRWNIRRLLHESSSFHYAMYVVGKVLEGATVARKPYVRSNAEVEGQNPLSQFLEQL